MIRCRRTSELPSPDDRRSSSAGLGGETDESGIPPVSVAPSQPLSIEGPPSSGGRKTTTDACRSSADATSPLALSISTAGFMADGDLLDGLQSINP